MKCLELSGWGPALWRLCIFQDGGNIVKCEEGGNCIKYLFESLETEYSRQTNKTALK